MNKTVDSLLRSIPKAIRYVAEGHSSRRPEQAARMNVHADPAKKIPQAPRHLPHFRISYVYESSTASKQKQKNGSMKFWLILPNEESDGQPAPVLRKAVCCIAAARYYHGSG